MSTSNTQDTTVGQNTTMQFVTNTPQQGLKEVPTSSPIRLIPTYVSSPNPTLFVTSTPPRSVPTTPPLSIPTIIASPRPPLATSKPQPTKVPKPSPTAALPPVTSDVRPGKSIEEILSEAAKRTCVPYAFLMAERMEESGAWFTNMTAQTTTYYNTYGWWTGADHGEICYGLAYYTQTGTIPPDSTNAGTEPCPHAPFGGGTYDQKIMGLFQVNEDEQKGALKYMKGILPGRVDRRVLFDNAVIFAIISKNRAGNSPMPTCTDWPEETVKLIAEKHYGACAYSGGNYCNEVWNYYKKYK